MDNSGIAFKVLTFFAGLSGAKAYAVIFCVLFLCGVGLPVPEDITLIAAGYLSGKGNISFIGAMIVGFFGVLVGDTLLFLIGRKFGRAVFKWPGARRMFTPERIEKAEQRIHSNAKLICFTARFAPGLRAPVYLTSGILRVPFRTFITQDGLAALVSVPVWIWAGWKFHDKIDKAFDIAKEAQLYLLGAVGLVVLFLIAKHYWKKKKTKESMTTRISSPKCSQSQTDS